MNDLLFGTFITSSLTLIGTASMTYYTRKNLKISKYIDTVTAQRVAWIETIREEVAIISTHVFLTLGKMTCEINSKLNQNIDPNSNSEYYKMQMEEFSVNTTVAFNRENEGISLSDLIFRFKRLKLRLNINDNSDLVLTIDYFIEFYNYSEMRDETDIKAAKEKLNQFELFAHSLLKSE